MVIRGLIGKDETVDGHGFRLRGREVSRLEGLSDAVFGFAITLLVVSLEVPRSFDELMAMMGGFVSFGICFALLLVIWHAHYTFFRRYGLHDFPTIVLNAVLLFVVLLYIYPLKFMFTLLVAGMAGVGRTPDMQFAMTLDQAASLMTLYSLSVVAVFGLLLLMHVNALRLRDSLALDALELHITRTSIRACAIWMAVGVLSIALAQIARVTSASGFITLAGVCYALLGPLQAWNGFRGARTAPARTADDAPATATASLA